MTGSNRVVHACDSAFDCDLFRAQVMEDYDLCGRCRRKPEAEVYAPFTEMRAPARRGESITVPL